MKAKKQYCPSDDYDFYTIPLPPKLLLNSRKNKYICGQLEKLHPCFSDDCSFDSFLSLEKKGLRANVLVMYKHKIAEYKANKSRLFIKECKYHQFFVEGKKKVAGLLSGLLLLTGLCLLAFLPDFVGGKEGGQASGQASDQASVQTSQNPPASLSPQDLPKGLYAPQVLYLVAKNGTYIRSFSWNYDGFTEALSMQISGLYPEQLVDFSPQPDFSSITFEDAIPLMTISFNENQSQTVNKNFPEQELLSLKKDFRSLILSSRLVLSEESVNPFGLKLLISKDSKKDFILLLEYIRQKQLCLSSINIIADDLQTRVQLIFSSVKLCDQTEFLNSLIENLQLFHSPEKDRKSRKVLVEKKQEPQSKNFTKVGQIQKPDGSITSYYKDEKGKIIAR